MEQTVIFEEKVTLTPKDMNRLVDESLDNILLSHLREKLENKCSNHGFVIPRSLTLLSRSMGQLENGRFTANVLFQVQAEGKVLQPVNGMKITGEVLKKNKMGLYVIYKDAIRILVPRDHPSHHGNEAFESIEPGETITVEIRKSRFQVYDPFILSVGILVSSSGIVNPIKEADAEAESDSESESEAVVAPSATAQNVANATQLRELLSEA